MPREWKLPLFNESPNNMKVVELAAQVNCRTPLSMKLDREGTAVNDKSF